MKAPCQRRRAATLEQSAKSGTDHPRYRMTGDALSKGQIRVVPWSFSAPDAGQGRFFFSGNIRPVQEPFVQTRKTIRKEMNLGGNTLWHIPIMDSTSCGRCS